MPRTAPLRPRTAKRNTTATDAVALEVFSNALLSISEEMGALLSQRPELAESISSVIARRRLEVEKKLAASPEAAEEQEQNLAQQILSRIRVFFRGAMPSNGQAALTPARA